MAKAVRWHCKYFEDLKLEELYNILRLRSRVFVVEQACVYQDMDGVDTKAFHVFATNSIGEIVACTRLLAPGVSYKEQSIGRVVVSEAERSSGLGRELMKKSIGCSYEHFGKGAIKIGAQLYLKKFYGSLGFEQCSDVYDEDGIDHIKMLKPVANLSDIS